MFWLILPNKSTLDTREKNINLYNETVNIFAGDNDLKPSSLGGVMVVHDYSDQEDNLKGMSSFVDDS